MAYTALYRKFRPLNFSEMVGQEHITETLKKQIIAERVGHAYLFNGGRGTGKTSAAKILARAVNCLNKKNGEPCNECEICKSIISGSLTDVVEMDAASNNSVEDIRSIREEVNFLPTRAKYRVYIIDEVHMLTISAFNALLKTLEEPPEHVKFILATTEPQKLPATILSRCQRFDFKKISNEDIVKRLETICTKSNIEITKEALTIIAVLSEGAMRDAISILERCTGEEKGVIDGDYIRDLVGIPKTTQIYEIVKAVIEYNFEKVIEVANIIITQGKDIDYFLFEIIKYVKDLLIYKTTNNLEIYSEEEKNKMSEIIEQVSKERLLKIIYDLSKLASDIKWSTQKTIMFQAGMINECMKEEPQPVVMNKTEVNIPDSKNKTSDGITKNVENKPTINEKPANKNQESVTNSSISYWNKVLDTIKKNGKMGLYVNLIGSSAKNLNDMVVEITLANKNTFAKQVIEAYENKSELEKIISQEAGKPMTIKIVGESEKKVKANNQNSIENIANNFDIPFNVIDE